MKRINLFLVLLIILITSCQAAPVVAPTQALPPSHTPQPESAVLPTSTSQPVPLQKTYEDMVVGFVEHSGGGWNSVNTESFKLTAAELGISIRFYETANPDREGNQDLAIRAFTEQPDVNVIVIAPQKTTSWDEILKEARARGKAVIFEGYQTIDATEDLYATYVGPDFVEQGHKAGQAMVELLKESPKKNIVELTGTEGYSGTSERAKGFHEAIEGSSIVITQSQTANWDREEGKQATEAWLKETTDIQGVFAQDDEMALGAIEAIKEAGLKPGVDIKIVSINGTSAALQAMIAGDLNATVEYNPFLAPQVYEAALRALNGETLPKRIASKEGIYVTPLQAQEELQRRQAEGIEW